MQRLPGFAFRFAEPWTDVVLEGDGVTVHTGKTVERFDAVLLGTGFDVDLGHQRELAEVHSNVRLWADLRAADEAAAFPDAARCPYLGAGFELQERRAGETPGLERIRLFNWGSIMSEGALAGDIPGLQVGANRIVQSIAHALFREDADRHFASMQAHEDPELAPTDYFVPRDLRSGTT